MDPETMMLLSGLIFVLLCQLTLGGVFVVSGKNSYETIQILTERITKLERVRPGIPVVGVAMPHWGDMDPELQRNSLP